MPRFLLIGRNRMCYAASAPIRRKPCIKRRVLVILILGCTFAQGQRCNHCQADQHYHLFSCANDCPGASGACSCVIGDRDQSCYECGCRYWVDGQTGYAICSDPTGTECGNFSCQYGTIQVGATPNDTRPSGAALIVAAPWLESATSLEIRGHNWTLYHHIHEIDKEIKTVAHGSF